MTKIDIISGFLGAGKTTLIKKLIKEGFKGEKLVLIENEFGEIGIDGGFLKEGGIEITEMNSGCICCSLVGDFGTALKDVLSNYKPDRVIIEPSGVGKLSDVIKAVQNIDQEVDVKLNCKTAVVDALKCKMYMKNFGEFFNNQIESASCIILSRTQKVSQEKLEECVAMIREHNEKATIVTTQWDAISGEKLLEAMEGAVSLEMELMHEEEICPSCGGHHHHEGHDHECCEHDHHHHHADEVFTSWGIETPHKFKEEDIKKALETLSHTEEYGIILRAKGILQNEVGNWFCFDMVPGEYEIREEAADYTGRLCVIGTKLDEDGLKKLFGTC
ncbi:MAG: GTP-binding protein [Candidatus Cellulosilyticum pullistercoris]|uniref:GTP-binding protein n=1 Tax=Candidatus Cellulosilyticum pullistercoris TaxID=2838521 RepID=A0A9E2KC44_9FIRM|nr:GTP-binding protein [Candidatus Cellulosilyticum pullistercoris]